MKTLIKALLLVLASQSLACARHVVLAPEQAAQKNSQDWTIQQEPKTSSAPAAYRRDRGHVEGEGKSGGVVEER